jgi:uncharacterized protein
MTFFGHALSDRMVRDAWAGRLTILRLLLPGCFLLLPSLEVPVNALLMIVMPQRLAICRLGLEDDLPNAVHGASFWSATRTEEEMSLVIPEEFVSPGCRCDRGWRAFKVAGPLDLTLTGVLNSISDPLAHAGIALFALSTYDTDYVLVREKDLETASEVLSKAGHRVERYE